MSGVTPKPAVYFPGAVCHNGSIKWLELVSEMRPQAQNSYKAGWSHVDNVDVLDMRTIFIHRLDSSGGSALTVDLLSVASPVFYQLC